MKKIPNENQLKPFDCMICGREFELDEIFAIRLIIKDGKYIVGHCECNGCTRKFKNRNKEEKDIMWGIFKKTLNGYMM